MTSHSRFDTIFSGKDRMSRFTLKEPSIGLRRYHPVGFTPAPATITAIPYYAWNNRGPNMLRVWINKGS
jgi:DUF1680 family protein